MEFKLYLILASVGTGFTALFGGWTVAMTALVIFIIIDLMTGFLKGVINKEVRSKNMFKGMIKKGMIFLIIVVAHQLDLVLVLGFPMVQTAVVYFYLAQEGVSVLENMGQMGVKYPKFLENHLEQLKDKGDSGNISGGSKK